MAYERVLLAERHEEAEAQLVEVANQMLPVFVQHALWRPKAREFVAVLMRDTDIGMLREDLDIGVRLASRSASTSASRASSR